MKYKPLYVSGIFLLLFFYKPGAGGGGDISNLPPWIRYWDTDLTFTIICIVVYNDITCCWLARISFVITSLWSCVLFSASTSQTLCLLLPNKLAQLIHCHLFMHLIIVSLDKAFFNQITFKWLVLTLRRAP